MNRLFLLSLWGLFIFGCKNEVYRESEGKVDESTFEFIQDRAFKNGITIRGDNSANPEAIGYFYPFGKNEEKSHWSLAQWGTRHLMNHIESTSRNDTIIYQGEAKRLFFYPREDKDIQIGLEVFGSREYPSPRKLGDDWVHLLIEQSFSKLILLKTIESINYKIKAKLLFCDNRMGDAFNSEIHTAQVTLFLTVQNRIKDSPQYGDFFWFGLPLYDYRHEKIAEYGAQDLGKDDASKKFISTVASDELFPGSMHSMNWVSIEKDIYPLIKKSFETAQIRGYMVGSKWEDLCITSMNLGWEVPGTFDCGILFDTPSLIAVAK